ncbi:MAG: exodeoxyribonuclease VII small subunit [Pseudomonadales bacterium]|nr:exodeoxyribonuclease VII small subunit [Pseudomonadales bacterium]
MTENENPIPFEQSLQELEAIVKKMEQGELSLDDSLKAFERGVALSRQCQNALKDAELKVAKLTAEGTLEPFNLGTDLEESGQ